MTEIEILDYGLNNLKSVRKGFERVGKSSAVVSTASESADPVAIVLPGIGSFGDAMVELRERGFVDLIVGHVDKGRPMLGICLGMQLLFSASHEMGHYEGLDLIPGEVVPFDPPSTVGLPGYKVPHMGWAEIQPPGDGDGGWDGTILEGTASGSSVYFVHSLYPSSDDGGDAVAIGEHGDQRFAAAVQRGNVTGTQFHPEKSGDVGLGILEQFCRHYSL